MKISFLTTAISFAIACLISCSKNTNIDDVVISSTAFAGAYPAPPVRSYPSSSQKIYGWINTMDKKHCRTNGFRA